MTAAIPLPQEAPRMHPLLAQEAGVSPWWYAGLGPLLMLLGGAAKWAWDEYRKNKADREQKQANAQATYIQQLEAANTRLAAENQDCNADGDRLTQQVADLRVYAERKDGYVKYLQAILKANKIPYDTWNGSGPPAPPPPEAKP